MTAVLRISGIAKRFGATVALDAASLEVQPGEVHALVGENGAGKSTLLAVVSGLVRPDAGTIQVGGEPYAPRSPRDARASGIALIHQELSLFPHLSVAENVLMGAEPRRHGLWDRTAPGAGRTRCSPSSATARSIPTRRSAGCRSAPGRWSRSAARSPRARAWS